MFAYTVRCTFSYRDLADEWVDWLRNEHLADVCEAGAIDAEVVRLESDPVEVEVRYHFPSREIFNRYEQEHAPRLRKEGLERFPLDRGLSFHRSVGEVVHRHGADDQPERD